MRLVRDHSAGAYAVRVPCLACGHMAILADCTVDVDGPAFRAYYCASHHPADDQGRALPVKPCDRPGCARCDLTGRRG